MRICWEEKKLQDLCDIFTDGDWIESKDQSENGIRLIQTGNIGDGFFKDRSEKARYISESTFKRLRCTEIFEGDCLISRLPDPVGRACILPRINERMITAVDCAIVRFNSKKIIPQYFNYFSQTIQYLHAIEQKTSGATRKRISRDKLGNIMIPVPSIFEQKHIASMLDETFSTICRAKENAETNLKNAKELFESYLQGVFKCKGDGWEEKRFDKVCVLQRGFDLPTHARNEGGHPLVSSNGITDRIDLWKVKAPGVVTGRSGTIGNVHYIEEDYWPLNTALYIKEFNGNYAKCIFYFLKQFDLGRYSTGTGVPTLNRNNVHSEMVWFPKSLNTQRAIVKKLDTLLAETKKLEVMYQTKISELEVLKKSILQKAFSGKLTRKN